MNGAHAPARAHAVRGQEQLNEQGGENDREMTGGDGTEHMRGPVPALALNVQLWPPCPALPCVVFACHRAVLGVSAPHERSQRRKRSYHKSQGGSVLFQQEK
jgi:hypothetical protein